MNRGEGIALAAVMALGAACGKERAAPSADRFMQIQVPASPASAPSPTMRKKDLGRMGRLAANADLMVGAMGADKAAAIEGIVGTAGVAAKLSRISANETAEELAPTRSWFPETFLFAPLVTTDASGLATLPVRVPDRLTRWRVLALAHSRAGGQAGSETTFEGTLPTYVDPVTPAFLSVGDVAALPIQIVNTTDKAITVNLQVRTTGAALSGVPGTVRIEAQGSQVVYASLRAGSPGQVKLTASLGAHDAVERSFPVQATGRPVFEERGGTLAAPRKIDMALPTKLDAAGATVRLQLFPGALAVLRAELEAATLRGGGGSFAADAYALLLAARGASLLGTLGAKPSTAGEESLRALSLVAGQRVIRAARSPSVLDGAVLAEAALAHPGNPILARLGERLVDTIANAQRPDGTFAGGDGWTLQRLLVLTAECVRVVRASNATPAARQRAARVSTKAIGAFERNLARVEDGYTAAALLGSGIIEGASLARLRELVRTSVAQDPDGLRQVVLKSYVQRSDGLPPTSTEGAALAVLALREDPEASAIVSDLGARVLSNYDPLGGGRDGRTQLAALNALLALFSGELPAQVAIKLSQDGKVLAERSYNRAGLGEVLIMQAPLARAAGTHVYEIHAEPAVPGLGFRLTVQGFAPWEANRVGSGLDLAITSAGKPRVGQPLDMTVQASAPSGLAFTIQHRLPAGVQPDKASLEGLVSGGVIGSFAMEDGKVTLEIAGLPAGKAFLANYRVIPTLAGSLNAPASSLLAGGITQHVPSPRWVVGR